MCDGAKIGLFIGKNFAGLSPDAERAGVDVRAVRPARHAVLNGDSAEDGRIEQRGKERAGERWREIKFGGEAISEGECEAAPIERHGGCE